MLGVSLVEQLLIDGAVIDQRRRHVPIGNNHAIVTAVLAQKHVRNVLNARGIEGEKPVARVTHYRFTSEVVEFQNQICIVMLAHFCSPVPLE